MSVNRVQRKVSTRREFDNFRAGQLQFAGKRIVVGLSPGTIRLMMETKFLPAREAIRLIPTRGTR